MPSNILNPARRVFAPAQVHVAEIETVDLDEKRIVTLRRNGAGPSSGTTAVVSLGNGENLEAYPGLAEHAYRLKSFDDCFRLKNHIIEMFELADLEADPDERRLPRRSSSWAAGSRARSWQASWPTSPAGWLRAST